MPTISRFFGIVIQMVWREHSPPNFHALYAKHARYCRATGSRCGSKMEPNGIADLSTLLVAHDCGIDEPLRDLTYFDPAHLELGIVTWPNGADLDPAWMFEQIKASST